VTPYYDDGQSTIYHADCLDVLPTLAGVGLVLTSPPYNLSGDGNKPGHTLSNGRSTEVDLSNGYGVHDDAMPHAEYVAWQRDVLRACWAALTDDGAIFYNHKPIVRGNSVRLPLELVPDEMSVRQIVTWDRGSGFNRRLTYFVPSYEWVLILARPAFRIATYSVDDVWRIPFETGGEHPAPFPLRLARTAVAATRATLVVDPFMGSGTTLRAAKDGGRRAIGIEIEERFCEMAARRLSQEVLDLWAGGDGA
jgi:site-specific DNA-methyltransferase (adenine-specific)